MSKFSSRRTDVTLYHDLWNCLMSHVVVWCCMVGYQRIWCDVIWCDLTWCDFICNTYFCDIWDAKRCGIYLWSDVKLYDGIRYVVMRSEVLWNDVFVMYCYVLVYGVKLYVWYDVMLCNVFFMLNGVSYMMVCCIMCYDTLWCNAIRCYVIRCNVIVSDVRWSDSL